MKMRLDNFLKEEESLKEILLRKVLSTTEIEKSFIKLIEKDIFFYRGTRIERSYRILTPRKDRYPRDTPDLWHNLLDEEFKRKFGWRVRSEGIFTNTNLESTRFFGYGMIFIPIGKYKYVYSPYISDFDYNDLEDNYCGYYEVIDYDDKDTYEEGLKVVKEFINNNKYTNKNIDKIIPNKKIEVIFKCNKFILIPNEDKDILKNYLTGR
jgi:hypothetical protein